MPRAARKSAPRRSTPLRPTLPGAHANTSVRTSAALLVAALSTVSIVAVAADAATPLSAQAVVRTPALDRTAFTTTVYEADNDVKGTSFLSRYVDEVNDAATKYGYPNNLGGVFRAAGKPVEGAVGVHRLWKASGGFLYICGDSTELQSAIAKNGFVDQGVAFYASSSASAGLVGVYRLRSPQNRFYYTVDKADRDAKLASGKGWAEGFIAFYAAALSAPTPVTPGSPFTGRVQGYAASPTMADDVNPAGDADGKFSIAVLPDTQEETSDAARGQTTSSGLDAMSTYVVKHKASDDIRFVTSSGDLNNWVEREPAQMTLTKKYLDKMHAAGLPFSLAIGNHDSGAVGSNNGPATDTTYGGSAYVANPLCLKDPVIHSDPYLIALANQLGYGNETCKTRVLIRQTGVTNAALPFSYLGRVTNSWEPNKLDNSWNEFSAGGKKFAILDLEFNARNEVVDWANAIVSAHPDTNVIVVTHSYLNPDLTISSNAEYGVNSGQLLTTKLISKHSNIKAVFCGHAGEYGARTDTYNGNKVATFLETMHRTNPQGPVRMVQIDTVGGTISTKIVNGQDGSVYANSETTIGGINFVG